MIVSLVVMGKTGTPLQQKIFYETLYICMSTEYPKNQYRVYTWTALFFRTLQTVIRCRCACIANKWLHKQTALNVEWHWGVFIHSHTRYHTFHPNTKTWHESLNPPSPHDTGSNLCWGWSGLATRLINLQLSWRWEVRLNSSSTSLASFLTHCRQKKRQIEKL